MSDVVKFVNSIRFRLSVLYSSVVFGLGGAILGVTYYLVRRTLSRLPFTLDSRIATINGRPIIVQNIDVDTAQLVQQAITQRAVELLANHSIIALGVLFVLSLIVGWVIAGRALRPVARITSVAQEISASDLSRRIAYSGPPDELSRLAETFDEMLERLDAAFSSQKRFLADTSHDLRTPLAVIRSNIEVLADDPEATLEEWRDVGEIVQRNAAQMADMIDDLLAAARLEVRSAAAVHLDLADLVNEVAEETGVQGRERDVAVEAHALEATVKGVPASLRRAIGNLVDNALKVAPEGTKVILASGATEDWAWAAVADEGPGIDPAVLEKAGRRGLGLAIVRQIAEAHKGFVAAQKGAERGTTVVIWIPRVTEPGEPPAIEDLPTV